MLQAPTKNNLKLEAIGQSFFMVPLFILLIIGLIYGMNDYKGGPFCVFLLLLASVVQVGTAIVRIIRHGSKLRWNYIRLLFGFVLVIVWLSTLSNVFDFMFDWIAVLATIVPLFFASSYWLMTIGQATGYIQDSVKVVISFKKPLVSSLEEIKTLNNDDEIVQKIALRQKDRVARPRGN